MNKPKVAPSATHSGKYLNIHCAALRYYAWFTRGSAEFSPKFRGIMHSNHGISQTSSAGMYVQRTIMAHYGDDNEIEIYACTYSTDKVVKFNEYTIVKLKMD